jgi:hypothetical protein
MEEKLKKLDHQRVAEGKHTGHSHEAVGASALYEVSDNEKRLEAPDGAQVFHQEHNVIKLPSGNWRVGTVLERDHALEATRKVVD